MFTNLYAIEDIVYTTMSPNKIKSIFDFEWIEEMDFSMIIIFFSIYEKLFKANQKFRVICQNIGNWTHIVLEESQNSKIPIRFF